MRKLFITLLLMAMTAAASAATLKENIDRTFDVRTGSRLTLDNVNGKISINSWDQPRIRVQAVKSVERTDPEDAKKALAELKVEMTPRDGGLTVRTIVPKQNSAGIWDAMFGNFNNATVQYDITVPRSMNLEVSNTNGRVHLAGVSGAIQIETTNGKIEVDRCAGSFDLETTNGAVEASLVAVDAQKPLKVETTNGHIEITLPASVRANVEASTTNGSIETQLPVATKSVDRHSLRGTVNGGGASVSLRTTNGGISIRSQQ